MYFISAVLSLAVLAGLVFWVWKSTAAGTCWNPVFWPALIFKLVCGILLGIYYSGGDFDTTRYQEAADILTGFGFQDAGAYLRLLFLNDYTALPEQIHSIGFRTYSNSFYFSKLLSVLNFLTGSNYYLNSLFLSFFSFAGCWYLVKTLSHYFPGTANAAIFSFLLFPSVVFWNAGVMKESLLEGLLGFFWAAILNLSDSAKKHKPGYFFLLAISAFGLWKIKFFVAAFVYGLAGLWLVLHWLRRRFRVFRQPVALVGSLAGLSALLAFAISRLHENFKLQFFLDRLVWNYQALKELSPGRPTIQLSTFEPEMGSVLLNIPEALLGVLYRPFIWEGDSILYRLAGAENLLLIIITVGVLAGLPQILKRKFNGFYLVMLVFGLVLAVTFALATPNLGSLNRYRVTFLPFLLYLALQAPVWQRLMNRLRL